MAISARAGTQVWAAQVLFYLNAVIWMALGGWSLARLAGVDPAQAVSQVIIAMLMFVNAAAMLVSGLGLGTRRQRFYYLALAVLAVNIILTVTDQFGVIDLITLLIDLVLVALLLRSYAVFSIISPSS